MQIAGSKELMEEVRDRDLCSVCGGCVGICPYHRDYKGKIAMTFECDLPKGQCYAYCPKTESDLEGLSRMLFGEPYQERPLGTTWPLPPELVTQHLKKTDRFLVVEEVIPFLEENIKMLAQELAPEIGQKLIHGKRDGSFPTIGEMNPDLVIGPLADILGIGYQGVPKDYAEYAAEKTATGAPAREWTFCPGCPHRASFWTIHNVLKLDNNQGFVCGDIGCYTMAMGPTGFNTLRTVHSMGSGTGIASGFGKLKQFGMEQPVITVCGDSTFFHTVMPALVNAIHHRSNIILIVLDNGGTAMTGFQPHPGLEFDARGENALKMDIGTICTAMGAEVRESDPFDFEATRTTLFNLLESGEGVKVLILKQLCALSPEKKRTRKYEMFVNPDICKGDTCGCNKLCTRIFRCPGLNWDEKSKTTRIDEAICVGCGVCEFVCPTQAIGKKEVA